MDGLHSIYCMKVVQAASFFDLHSIYCMKVVQVAAFFDLHSIYCMKVVQNFALQATKLSVTLLQLVWVCICTNFAYSVAMSQNC